MLSGGNGRIRFLERKVKEKTRFAIYTGNGKVCFFLVELREKSAFIFGNGMVKSCRRDVGWPLWWVIYQERIK